VSPMASRIDDTPERLGKAGAETVRRTSGTGK
jgi:hypothetical protein